MEPVLIDVKGSPEFTKKNHKMITNLLNL